MRDASVTLDWAIAKLYSTDTCVAVAPRGVELCAARMIREGRMIHPRAVRLRERQGMARSMKGTNQIQRRS